MVESTKADNGIFGLTGKKTVVTGAGRCIGRVVAPGLARAGADIGLVARSQSELDKVAEEIKSMGRRSAETETG